MEQREEVELEEELGKSIGIDIPDSCHRTDFVAFFHVLRN